MNDDRSLEPDGPGPPPVAQDQRTIWTSSIFRLCEELIGLRETNNRQHKLFEQALALFQQIGLHGQVPSIQAQLEQLPERSSPRRSLPAGLSSREVEVLRLVAQGKSNRQIAEALVLSEKTVINHLTSIFNKTVTDNRAAATAFAIRHGLA